MEFNQIIRLWTGPLPIQELFPLNRQVNPLLHWFIHPIKRRIAKYYLLILQKFFGIKVIAITGSTGKTTTTNLLYSVLSKAGSTIKTADSITTTYNLPTTILKCTPATRYLILEMGVEYPGDMDFYCWLAKPDIATVLNITAVHSSFLGTLDQIKAEKYKLQKYSKIFIPPEKFSRITSSVITNDFKTQIKIDYHNSQFSISIPILGTHFSQNVAAVTNICECLLIPQQII
jgi:UDP-N-acetylmuramyl pentapeptide synthase